MVFFGFYENNDSKKGKLVIYLQLFNESLDNFTMFDRGFRYKIAYDDSKLSRIDRNYDEKSDRSL